MRNFTELPLPWGPTKVVVEANGDTHCKTYLVVCHAKKRAALIDPIKPRVGSYLALLAYHHLKLDYAMDSHTHADHITGRLAIGIFFLSVFLFLFLLTNIYLFCHHHFQFVLLFFYCPFSL